MKLHYWFKPQYLQLLVLACFVAFLMFQAYIGHFSRYMADDYCTATVVLKEGLINSVGDWYFNWTGRYTFNTLIGVVSLLGVMAVTWIPALVIISWFVALTWLLYQIAVSLRIHHAFWNAALFSGLILYAVLSGTTSITQSLYWVGGTLLYTFPLVLLTVYLGFFVNRLQHPVARFLFFIDLLFTALITFVAGGLSEVYVVFQIAVLGLVGLGVTISSCSYATKRRALSLIAVGLMCSLLALFIMMIAPGNAIRRPNFGDPLPFPDNILQILKISTAMIATNMAIHAPIELLISFFLSMFFVIRFLHFEITLQLTRRHLRTVLALSALLAIGLFILCVAPPVYLYPVPPPDRMHIIPHLILVCTAVFWGIIVGVDIKQKGLIKSAGKPVGILGLSVLTIILLIGPIAAAWYTLEAFPAFKTFATEWDTRDQQIREAAHNLQDLQVPYLSVDVAGLAGLDIIGSDPNTWMNTCVASYYNVRSIRAVVGID